MEKVIISNLQKENISYAAKLINILHNNMVKKRQETFILKEENFEKYLEERINNKDYILLQACIKGKLVGVCTAEIKHLGDGIETVVRDIVFVDYIAVKDNYKRCKIGTKLLDEIKRITKKNNIKRIELNVWGFNKGAIKFYEKNNMVPKRIVYEYLIDKEN